MHMNSRAWALSGLLMFPAAAVAEHATEGLVQLSWQGPLAENTLESTLFTRRIDGSSYQPQDLSYYDLGTVVSLRCTESLPADQFQLYGFVGVTNGSGLTVGFANTSAVGQSFISLFSSFAQAHPMGAEQDLVQELAAGLWANNDGDPATDSPLASEFMAYLQSRPEHLGLVGHEAVAGQSLTLVSFTDASSMGLSSGRGGGPAEVSFSVTAVPEPGLMLVTLGAMGSLVLLRRRAG